MVEFFEPQKLESGDSPTNPLTITLLVGALRPQRYQPSRESQFWSLRVARCCSGCRDVQKQRESMKTCISHLMRFCRRACGGRGVAFCGSPFLFLVTVAHLPQSQARFRHVSQRGLVLRVRGKAWLGPVAAEDEKTTI